MRIDSNKLTVIQAEPRQLKSELHTAPKAQREGQITGHVFGVSEEPLAVTIKYTRLLKVLLRRRLLSTLFDLRVAGMDDSHVVCRAVQRNPVADLPTHVDFRRLKDDERINLFIKVEFVNREDSPGLEAGGTLTVVRNEVELEVLAGNIPECITVDMANKNIGDVVHIQDVDLPEGTKPTISRNFVIASIAAPSYLEGAQPQTTPNGVKEEIRRAAALSGEEFVSHLMGHDDGALVASRLRSMWKKK